MNWDPKRKANKTLNLNWISFGRGNKYECCNKNSNHLGQYYLELLRWFDIWNWHNLLPKMMCESHANHVGQARSILSRNMCLISFFKFAGLVFEFARCLNYSSGFVLGTCSGGPFKVGELWFGQERVWKLGFCQTVFFQHWRGPAEQVPRWLGERR